MNDGYIRVKSQPISARFGDCKDIKEFIQPQTLMVQDLIETLQTPNILSEDEKILAYWKWVAESIKYPRDRETFALTVYGKTIRSNDYFLEPSETIAFKIGKCDATSNLLTSMLRNILPEHRVYTVLGDLAKDGVGGHAWVTVERQGKMYILESTLDKLPENPWVAADTKDLMYRSVMAYNDKEIWIKGAEITCALPLGNCKVPWLSDYFCQMCAVCAKGEQHDNIAS